MNAVISNMANTHSSTSENKDPSCRDRESGLLETPLPFVNDAEGEYVPFSAASVIDAHVHLFPNHLFSAVWQWFEKFGWPIRYKLTSKEIIEFLLSRGISHIVALHYAHKPGVSRDLNAYMADLCRSYPQLTAMATVYPGEQDADLILEDAFRNGLGGVKLHCHVQCFDMNGDRMNEIYQICTLHQKPLIMHVGREPKSPAYPCDPYVLCSADKLERVLKDFPTLKLCVPHLGADEFDDYRNMLEKYDNLWLDTTMTLADYLPMDYFPKLSDWRTDRIIFGTDFPNLPYAWDREIRRLCRLNLPEIALARILGQNASEFYSIIKKCEVSKN
jgi:predicted TIM-barrel fold metal-dependent hydrolase